MASQYKQSVSTSSTRFTSAPQGEIEFSSMYANPVHITDFSAGDIVPIYCAEVLPHDTFKIDVNAVVRQLTSVAPTMGQLIIDIYAYEVPNRVVNRSWKAVQGENLSGQWVAPEVSLVSLGRSGLGQVQVPICSVADYYGYPTQAPLPNYLLAQMHDLKFRGYLEIYNNYFRDQNYQPPIAYSKLNVYEGFFEPVNTSIGVDEANSTSVTINMGDVGDGSVGAGAIANAVGGDGGLAPYMVVQRRNTVWSALDKPLKANKLHDYFTSVLPSPQKGPSVYVGGDGVAPVLPVESHRFNAEYGVGGSAVGRSATLLAPAATNPLAPNGSIISQLGQLRLSEDSTVSGDSALHFDNLAVKVKDLGISVNDLRNSFAIQQVYEVMARSGSRYREFVSAFFGLDVEDPFPDIPRCLGHIRRELDLYQTAQTSASTADGSAQGSLAAFGYTDKGGELFHYTFKEHGYIHIFAIVRHKNLYPAFLGRDNFRLNMLDFYTYPLANISEQPVYTREINPFNSDIANDPVFGYQEAWAEYRMEPDRVSGHMRTGISQSLSIWNYADPYDSSLQFANADWLKSNTEDVVRRTTALVEEGQPQFKGQFTFLITKERPMPTYSIPGLDII